MTIYDFSVQSIAGEKQALSEYKGKVVLIVNTASKCGFTPQYEGLEELYKTHGEKGFVVLGFPCNQFAGQEPKDNLGIQEFCQLNFGVSFPMFAKIDVNGNDAEPLFEYLKEQAPGLLGSKKIKWNFTKFLVNRDGQIVSRYAPTDTPKKIEKDIVKLL